MKSSATNRQKVSYVPIAIGAVAVLLLAGVLFYLNSSRSTTLSEEASATAKAYVKYLDLSDVRMQAAENFMQQQVVEIGGKITNKGQRRLGRVDVYCLFYSVDGRMIHRERVPIVKAKGPPLGPNETQNFRLPFDTLPSEWNQAMPKLVIAEIEFAG
jgi:hypothetical protein